VNTIERNYSLALKSSADLRSYLPVLLCVKVLCIAFVQAQVAPSNDLQTPQKSEQAAGEAKEGQPTPNQAEPLKSENNFDLVVPLEGQQKESQPNNGGIKPLITPFTPNNSLSPVDGAPQNIDGQIEPSNDGKLPDPANPENSEEEAVDGQAAEDADVNPEQEQVVSSFSDELFFSPSGNSYSQTLTPTPTLGSSDSSISEMAALIMPGLPTVYSDKGLSYTAGVSEIYDTNPLRLPEANNPGGDWITVGSMSVSYQPLNPSLWSVTASYSGGYTWYLDNENFNSVFQNGAGSIAYNGARLSSIFRGGFTMSSGVNRDIGVLGDQSNFSISNNSRYSLSNKTSIDSEISYRKNEFSSQVFEDQIARIGGIWHYSPITDLGLGFRRTYQSLSSQSERSSIGPSFLMNYRYSERLRLRSQTSLEFADINQNLSKTGLDTNIGVSFVPSAQWAITLDVRRSNLPLQGSVASFQSLTSVRLGCTRQETRSAISASLGYEFADIDEYGTAGVTKNYERKFLTFDASYTRAVYLDRLYGTIFMRYSDQSGSFPQLFVSTQLGLGFTHVF
jgi:hypothetical protein